MSKSGKTVVLTSVKGGSGKTQTTLNLAGVLSKMNKKVVIIDLDFYENAIATLLNLEVNLDFYALTTDISKTNVDITKYIIKYKENIDVIPSVKDIRLSSKIESIHVNTLINKLRYEYDVILIDTNYFLNDINLSVFDIADKILYVINNDPISLKSMKSMTSIYSDLEKTNYDIILNESINYNKISINQINKFLNYNIKFTIPKSFYIKDILEYMNNAKILTLDSMIRKNHRKTLETYEKIANSIM